MKKKGKIIHYTKSRLFVIKLDHIVSPGSYLLDASRKKIAVVIDLIGPISEPYCIAKPLVKKPESLVGKEVYSRLEKKRKE